MVCTATAALYRDRLGRPQLALPDRRRHAVGWIGNILGHAGQRDTLRYPDAKVLHLSAAEWAEFVAAVKAGKFDHVTGPSEAA